MTDPALQGRENDKVPAIRTMRLDVAEFLKTNQPSLVTLLTKQVESQEAAGWETPRSSFPWKLLVIILLGAVVLALALLGYLWFSEQPPRTTPPPRELPAAFFFSEETRETTTDLSRSRLSAALGELATPDQAIGTFRRILVRRTGEGKDPPVILQPSDLSRLVVTEAGRELAREIAAPPQFFSYRQRSGPELGVILEAKNPARLIERLLRAEPTLVEDFSFLFPAAPPRPTLKPYEDKTYKNIDYRFLRLDTERDHGLGYLHFPAKRLIVIATSEEVLRLVINRLFENR